jgi:2-keto-3-deoxy-L-rhamnonate aldolase RhmA
LVVQIETPEAIENVDAIAAVKGVDGMFVGPGDLGPVLSMASYWKTGIDSLRQTRKGSLGFSIVCAMCL